MPQIPLSQQYRKISREFSKGKRTIINFKWFFLRQNDTICDSLRWSHTHFICIPAVHIISFCVSFLSRVDELNKLAGLQGMGLHSSAGRALQRQRRGHGFESRWSPEILFFRLFRNCLSCDSLRWSHTHFIWKSWPIFFKLQSICILTIHSVKHLHW